MNKSLDVDSIIQQFTNSGGKNVKIKEKDISTLCKLAREVFMEQPVYLELEAPIKICGKSFAISANMNFRRCPRSVHGPAQTI